MVHHQVWPGPWNLRQIPPAGPVSPKAGKRGWKRETLAICVFSVIVSVCLRIYSEHLELHLVLYSQNFANFQRNPDLHTCMLAITGPCQLWPRPPTPIPHASLCRACNVSHFLEGHKKFWRGFHTQLLGSCLKSHVNWSKKSEDAKSRGDHDLKILWKVGSKNNLSSEHSHKNILSGGKLCDSTTTFATTIFFFYQ